MGELPEPWDTAAEKAGVRQTYRGIGEAAGLSHVTVRRLIAQGRTSPATIGKVAEALGVDESTVYQWAGVPVSDWGPWIPPREAHKLNPRAREALDELIRAITEDGGSQWSGRPAAEEPTAAARGTLGDALAQVRGDEPSEAPPAPVTRIDHRRARYDRDALPAQTAADDGTDSDGAGE